jgi:hypothetical protein
MGDPRSMQTLRESAEIAQGTLPATLQ